MDLYTLGLVHAGVDKIVQAESKRGNFIWKDVLKPIRERQEYYRAVKVTGMGYMPIKQEGGPALTDNQTRLYVTDFHSQTYAKAYEWSLEARDFDVYSQAAQMAKDLSLSYRHTINKAAADVINNGFSTSASPYTIYDGTYLFSASHPNLLPFASSSNLLTTTLSPAGLQTAIISLMNQTDERGMPLELEGGMTLLVGNALAPLAWELVQPGGKPQTADNDRNYLANIVVAKRNTFLTSTTGYCLKMSDDSEHGLCLIDFSMGLKLKTQDVVRTLTDLTVGFCRFLPAVLDYHGVVAKS